MILKTRSSTETSKRLYAAFVVSFDGVLLSLDEDVEDAESVEDEDVVEDGELELLLSFSDGAFFFL